LVAATPCADAWMQFDWTLALPMTLLIVYFLSKLQSHYWRIYKRFRLPAEAAVTGAFNMGGQLDGVAAGGDGGAQRHAVPTAEQETAERQYAREMELMNQQCVLLLYTPLVASPHGVAIPAAHTRTWGETRGVRRGDGACRRSLRPTRSCILRPCPRPPPRPARLGTWTQVCPPP
jgi:hypothetical protein